MLLDVFRHKQTPLLDVLNLVSDYKTSIKKGTGFSLNQLLSRVKNSDMKALLEDLFKLTNKLREAKAFKSLTTCTYFLCEALLTGEQGAFQSDMVTVIKHIIE